MSELLSAANVTYESVNGTVTRIILWYANGVYPAPTAPAPPAVPAPIPEPLPLLGLFILFLAISWVAIILVLWFGYKKEVYE